LVRRRPKSSQRKVPVAATPAAAGYEMDPLEYQLALMNDESLPPKQRAAIAKNFYPIFTESRSQFVQKNWTTPL
jgi:hypothetical protein